MGLYKGSLKLQTFGTSSFLDLLVIVWHSSAVLRIPTISTTSPLFLCSNWLIEMKLKIFCGTLKNFCFHFATFLKMKFFCPKKLKIVLLERSILRSNYCKSAQNFQLSCQTDFWQNGPVRQTSYQTDSTVCFTGKLPLSLRRAMRSSQFSSVLFGQGQIIFSLRTS